MNRIGKVLLFGVHRHSRSVLHATTQTVKSAGWFVDNHSSQDLSLVLERITYSSGVKGMIIVAV
jgi:hypothetical protein